MKMSKPDVPPVIEPVNGYFAGGNRRARQLAEAVPAIRPSKPTTARSRIAAGKTKKTRVAPLGPTAERLAKGDIVKSAGFHRSVSPVERLRDQGKLDHDAKTNQMMFESSEKLKRLFVGGQFVGVAAQDLNRVRGNSDMAGVEHVEQCRRIFAEARKLMGWSEENPKRGCARIVEAVVCHERTVTDAGAEFTGEGRVERIQAVGMDRLRSGLWMLASHWRLI